MPAELIHTMPSFTARVSVLSGLAVLVDVPSPGPSNVHPSDMLMTETPSEIIQSTMSARSPFDHAAPRYSEASGAMSMIDSATSVPWSPHPQFSRPPGSSVSVP